MNLAWILRRALLDCNVVRQDNTTSALFTLDELVSWAQDTSRELEALQRLVKEDFPSRTLLSTDAAFTFDGETYLPSSLQLLTSTLVYTLPPDLIQIKRIRSLSEESKHFLFTPMDFNHAVFRNLNQQYNENQAGSTRSTNPTGSELYYDIIGRKTLQFSHAMPQTTEIELIYNRREPNLFLHEIAGDIAVTNASAAVVASSGTLVASRLTTPSTLLIASDGGIVVPKVVTQTSTDPIVLPGRELEYPITSIDSDTTLTLAAVFPGVTDANVAAIISSSSTIMDDHYHLMVRYIRSMIYEKTGQGRMARGQMEKYEAGKKAYVYDITSRSQGVVFVEDWEG